MYMSFNGEYGRTINFQGISADVKYNWCVVYVVYTYSERWFAVRLGCVWPVVSLSTESLKLSLEKRSTALVGCMGHLCGTLTATACAVCRRIVTARSWLANARATFKTGQWRCTTPTFLQEGAAGSCHELCDKVGQGPLFTSPQYRHMCVANKQTEKKPA